MNPRQHLPPPATGLTVRDVYYVLFRHKWKIMILSLLAIGTAVGVDLYWPVPCESEARLLIKWVMNIRAPDSSSATSQVVSSPDDRAGENIINSEVSILSSEDVVAQAVDVVGPTKILAQLGGGSNRFEAIGYVESKLTNEVPLHSDIIVVAFTHPDPVIAQQVLAQLIDAYLKKHNEIHRPEISDFLRGEIDQNQGKLDETDKALRAAKEAAGIISLDDSKRHAGDETARLETEIRETQAQLGAAESAVRDRQKMLGISGLAPGGPNAHGSTNAGDLAALSASVVNDYQRLLNLLVSLHTKEQDLLSWTTTNNMVVKSVEASIADTDAKRQQMEGQYPALAALKATVGSGTAGSGPQGVDPRMALNEEIIKQDALAVKFLFLTNQLAQEVATATSISSAEGKIIELQRNRDLYERQLEFYHSKLDEARAQQAIGAGNSSIAVAEQPTIATRNVKKLLKACIGILVGGLGLAFSLPFLIEFYLDQSLKRASDVQIKLNVPAFIVFPKLNGNRKSLAFKQAKNARLLPAGGSPAPVGANGSMAVAKEKAQSANGELDRLALQPFFETLRDRLMTYFEMINLTHKPKLVAITSCGHRAGVTTTAAGLASSLSETGDGNVLLVDMNVRDGEAHHFYKGKLSCKLEEMLDKEKRDGSTMVQDNLYVAKEVDGNESLPRVLPKRFSHLVPKMRASDYDYIIFDMPPISQISITPRLARFMDMVLLVVESGKTDGEVAKQATKLLTESKTNVGVVVNKSREYLPRRLQHEI
jgi:polysaccharide biosynthesis transport protein